MRRRHNKTPLRDLRTFGRSHTVRLADCDYSGDEIIHLTICALDGACLTNRAIAPMIRENVEFYCTKLAYRLFGLCLMPDHLHVVLSPANSGRPLRVWLQSFKSFTTHQYQKMSGAARLWQESAYDHVCRDGETAETVLAYVVNNPVRTGLAARWDEWKWTRVFIEI